MGYNGAMMLPIAPIPYIHVDHNPAAPGQRWHRLVQTVCQINVRQRTGFCRLHNWTGPVRTDLNGSQ